MPSIFWDILYATKLRLETIPGIPTVKIRKKPILLQEDAIPLIILTPGKEVVGMEAFPNVVEYIYEVQISIIRAGNRIYEADVIKPLKAKYKHYEKYWSRNYLGDINKVLKVVQ